MANGTATETAAPNEGGDKTTTPAEQTKDDAGKQKVDTGKANGEGAGAGEAGKGGEEDWRDPASAGDQKLRNRLGQFTSVGDLAKSELEARQKLAAALFKPGKNAKPEEVAAFHKALGVPEGPDKYGLALPDDLPEHLKDDGTKEVFGEYLKVAHEAGLTPDQADRIAKWHLGNLARQDPDLAAAAQTVVDLFEGRDKWADDLGREWPGKDYEENLSAANYAIERLGSDEARTVLNRAGLGNHPAILRMLARVGRMVDEGPYHGAEDSGAARSTQEQIDSLTTEHFGKSSYGSPSVQNQLNALYRKLHGDRPHSDANPV